MWFKESLKDDSGFSLIEVIMAVAILALMTLPILNYFTNSSLRAIDGRDKQTATMAAENIIEELGSYSNHDQIRALLASPSPTASASPWTPSAPETDDATYMQRDLKLNNVPYRAKVQIKYSVYNSSTRVVDKSNSESIGSGTGDVVGQKFNSYAIPNPSEVYSPSNVVAVEDDEIDEVLSDGTRLKLSDEKRAALNEFYTTILGSGGSSVTLKNILDGLKRKICIDISYKDVSKKEYVVRVYYLYEYGSTYHTEVTLQQSEIEKSKLKNVFVFYNPLRDGVVEDEVRVRTGNEVSGSEQIPLVKGPGETGTAINDIGFYFAVQASDPAPYKITVSSSNAMAAKYYSNVSTVNGVTASASEPGAARPNAFVDTKSGKRRIGRIYVDIYEVRSDGSESDTVVAHMETTQSE